MESVNCDAEEVLRSFGIKTRDLRECAIWYLSDIGEVLLPHVIFIMFLLLVLTSFVIQWRANVVCKSTR